MIKKINIFIIVALPFLFFSFILGNSWQEDIWPKNLDVPYVPTPHPVVQKMLNLADLDKDDIVYDLGCGDGRILIQAAAQYGVEGIGVDIDSERIEESRKNAAAAGVDHLVEFYHQDLFKTDISDASVVMLYLISSVNLKLRPKLLRELKPGTKVISHDFDMDEWRPDKTSSVMVEEEIHKVYYWVIPANITGKWELKVENFSSGINSYLSFDQIYQFPQGKFLTKNGERELTEVQLNGDRISFTLEMANGSLNFTGRIHGDQMQGTVNKGGSNKEYNWKASRKPHTQEPLKLFSSQ
ncbi:class I SAM-dependent methyltransferase [bacterium]|nr:class I SAM-dependent methyltransferase [bacterium]